ncbi:MAG TPA: hypothetical protein VJ547_11875 [Candidatus Thermoplasmatota archaeon]|nr:hypothetical protein [Candidatus Thermoplasmatota archaeon]
MDQTTETCANDLMGCKFSGHTVIAAKPWGNRHGMFIVMAYFIQTGSGPEYVTWIYNHSVDDAGNGHYFSDVLEAAKDFRDR